MPDVRRAVRETVSGLPRTFWWLWTSTLVNRFGGFVVTFLALYLRATPPPTPVSSHPCTASEAPSARSSAGW
ncbi:hypothetical protein [Streptomyces sp. NPDC002547]